MAVVELRERDRKRARLVVTELLEELHIEHLRNAPAISLSGGAQFSIRNDAPSVGGATRSTAAVLKTRVYVGYGAGVYALSALTGAKIPVAAELFKSVLDRLRRAEAGGGDRVGHLGPARLLPQVSSCR